VPDPNVLIIREVLNWPDTEGQRSLAFDIGANIEDAFGCRQRRFLGRIDPVVGAFDSSRYQYEGCVMRYAVPPTRYSAPCIPPWGAVEWPGDGAARRM